MAPATLGEHANAVEVTATNVKLLGDAFLVTYKDGEETINKFVASQELLNDILLEQKVVSHDAQGFWRMGNYIHVQINH